MHFAAQPLVQNSYSNPIDTYSTNVMGTVNVLECAREIDSVRATLVVTTDKCYENNKLAGWNYNENDPMGGYDPYSSSKGCAELATAAYRQSFFSHSNSVNKIATARAGNVIGGGDWSENRLIPDAIKSFEAGLPLMIRNPLATRPWQHVLESLSGYLILTQALFEHGDKYASGWNFGPNTSDNRSVQEVIELLISSWPRPAKWEKESLEYPHEEKYLSLDCSKARSQLGWAPKWNLETAIQKTVQWQSAYLAKQNMQEISLTQIDHFMQIE
jgi:CDP-glucose 4,6-dehydratase